MLHTIASAHGIKLVDGARSTAETALYLLRQGTAVAITRPGGDTRSFTPLAFKSAPDTIAMSLRDWLEPPVRECRGTVMEAAARDSLVSSIDMLLALSRADHVDPCKVEALAQFMRRLIPVS